MNARKFLEILGIDLFPYAIGLSKFEDDAPLEQAKLEDIQKQVQGFDQNKMDDALNYTKGLFDEESARGEKIESKAFSLISVTAISAAFITGVSSLLPKGYHTIASLIILAVLYLLIVFSLTLTILLASKVVVVGPYKYSAPDVADVIKMNSQALLETRKERLAIYLYCCSKNNQLHNVKASYLMGAQLWFRNSIIVFLFLALILVPFVFSNTNDNSQPLVTPTVVTIGTNQSTQAIVPAQTFSSPSFITRPTSAILPTETPTALLVISTHSP
ncbi:MAG: hypothetical protein ABSA18_16085 [Dehalococcoidia bacterium]